MCSHHFIYPFLCWCYYTSRNNQFERLINTHAKLATGEIEIVAKQIEILNTSKPVPFQIDALDTSEEVRLKYRFLDLRTDVMQQRMRLRSKVTHYMRDLVITLKTRHH
jgi:aspartyl-tRNA synthetase